MKQKLSLLVNLLLFAAVIQAAPVSKTEAQKKAQQFISGKVAAARGTSTPDLQLATADGDNYYVFNVSGQQGFVIVSGDDRAPEILGYSDEGQFDAANIPSNMKAWLQGYADEIQSLKNMPEVAGARRATRAPERNWAAIDPLIKSKWDQGSPYNNLLNGNVTGCVATAMAQVMYYYKWPKEGTTAIPKSTNNSSLGPTVFDWNNMKNMYSGSESVTAKTAVATLMRYCGYSVNTAYGTGSSSAVASLAVNAFKSYFNYDQNIRYIERAFYSIDEWESIIYEELANDRPVMYGGSTVRGSGHEFVCDGYDSDGLFHFNWGWGGDYNGFFVLWLANPKGSGTGGSNTADGYSSGQSAIIGIQKPTEEPIIEEVKRLSVKSISVVGGQQVVINRSSINKDFSDVPISFNVGNATNKTFDVYLGLGLYDEQDHLVSNILSVNGGSCAPGSFYNTGFKVSFGANKTGNYKIIPISRAANSSTWLKDGMSDTYYIEATMSETSLTLRVMPTVNLKVTKVEYTRNKMAGILQEVKATIMNHGSEYNGNLYLVMNSNSGYSSAEQVALRAGQETDVYFHYTPGSAGTDTWHIGTGTSSSTWLSGGTGTQYIVPYEAYNDLDLDLTATVKNKTDGIFVFGNEMNIVIKAKNNNDKVYDGGISINEINKYTPIIILPGDSVLQEFTIDMTIGKTYTVKPKQVKGQYFVYSGTPITYTTANGLDVLLADGTNTMKAITSSTYEPTSNITAVDLRGVTTVNSVDTEFAEPNCLFVIDEDANIEGLPETNVIRGETAAKVELTDKSIGFTAPIDFTATEISYERTFTQGTDGTGSGWTTIILPFDVLKVIVGKQEIDWFHSSDETGKQFWLRQLISDSEGSVTFGYVSELKANTPYIIAVPGNKWGEEWNLIGKTLKFIGANATIVKDAETKNEGEHYSFVGTTIRQELDDVYALNDTGSTFKHGKATIDPFRAYFTPLADSNASRLIIRSVDSKTTAIKMPEMEPLVSGEVYTLDGRKVKGNLKKGVYIVNGKKMIK